MNNIEPRHPTTSEVTRVIENLVNFLCIVEHPRDVHRHLSEAAARLIPDYEDECTHCASIIEGVNQEARALMIADVANRIKLTSEQINQLIQRLEEQKQEAKEEEARTNNQQEIQEWAMTGKPWDHEPTQQQ